MSKSPDAFRTISEVAEWLGVQAHVLRFWESKFTQVKPVKRAGGRRYYRPTDMLLLGGIKRLLHDDGMTIKGVQKLLREKGTAEVAAMSQPISPEDEGLEDIESTVVQFRSQDEVQPRAEDALEEAIANTAQGESHAAPQVDAATQDEPQPQLFDLKEEPQDAVVTEDSYGLDAELLNANAEPDEARDNAAAPQGIEEKEEEVAVLPSFLHRRREEPAPVTDNEPAVKKPTVIDAPDPPNEDEIAVGTGVLGQVAGLRRLSADQAAAILPLMDELRAAYERQSSTRPG